MSIDLHRIFAANPVTACEPKQPPDSEVNAKLEIDCVDDHRVDAGIAVLDSGVTRVTPT